jgi:hypothetical protein
MEHSDFILFNITDGLNAMDKIRFRLLDMNNHPIAIAHIPRRWDTFSATSTVLYTGICSVLSPRF